MWIDSDRDGVRDRGESRAVRALAKLERARRRGGRRVFRVVARDRTNRKGKWSFTVSKVGLYRVRIVRPTGLAGFSARGKGRSRSKDSDVKGGKRKSAVTRVVRIGPGARSRRFDTGLLLVAGPLDPGDPGGPGGGPAQPFDISGVVWRDTDADGVRVGEEAGLENRTVQVWNASKTELLGQTETNQFGGWVLTVPDRVDYRVRVEPSGYYCGFARLNQGDDDTVDSDINWFGPDRGYTPVIPATQADAHIGAGLVVSPGVGNFVWADENANGIQDLGEAGVAGVRVELWDPAKTTLFAVATTNAAGIYRLEAPAPGDYRVRVLPPVGAGFSPKKAGADDQKDSDINPTLGNAGFTDVFTLAPNVISTTIWDAGLTG